MFKIIILIWSFIPLMVIYSIYDRKNNPDDYKWTLKYDNQIIKCFVEMPNYVDGKMTRWTGNINLKECSNGKSYLGATNIEVILCPKRNYC